MASNDVLPTTHAAGVIRTVLLADIAGSSQLMEENQKDTVTRWVQFVSIVKNAVLPIHGGRLVKSQGDGFLLEFPSVRPAVQAAFAIQQASVEANIGIAPRRQIHLKIGVQVGELIADEWDVYGHDVNLAARLSDLAGPGEVVVSADIVDELMPGQDADIEEFGERHLKGIKEPVRTFRVWPPGRSVLNAVSPRARMGDPPLIAVLPFRNLSRDVQHDFLGDVIADDVIGHLSRVAELAVISRLSTTPFRNHDHEPRNVARSLGVQYLLTGKIQFSGSRLRLMAELVEAEHGRVVWADRFDGSITNIFELQDEMSLSIAQRIVPFVRELELKRARAQRPENLTAYERMLQAIDYLHRGSHENLERAQAMLETAIQSDPSFVAPYAWLARLHVLRVGQGWSKDSEHDKIKANQYVESALEKDGRDSWALAVSGLVAAYLNKDIEKAIARYDTAITINPSSAPAWVWSTSAHAWLGQGKEAVKRAPRALDLSPFDPHKYIFTSLAGMAYAVDGQYDKAVELCRLSLQDNSTYTATHRLLIISLALSDRTEEARKAVAGLLKLEPELTVSGWRHRYPGSASAHANLFCEALGKAGVPQ